VQPLLQHTRTLRWCADGQQGYRGGGRQGGWTFFPIFFWAHLVLQRTLHLIAHAVMGKEGDNEHVGGGSSATREQPSAQDRLRRRLERQGGRGSTRPTVTHRGRSQASSTGNSPLSGRAEQPRLQPPLRHSLGIDLRISGCCRLRERGVDSRDLLAGGRPASSVVSSSHARTHARTQCSARQWAAWAGCGRPRGRSQGALTASSPALRATQESP
jgi:hypothetical protein